MNTVVESVEAERASMLVTLALVVVGSVGAGIFLCMPVIAPALVDVFGFTTKQIGQFSFIQLAFVSLGCIIGMLASKRFSVRQLSLYSLLVLLLMDLLSPHLSNYSAFLVARAMAGIAGGLAIALATGALAQLPGAERNFGFFLFSQISFSMLGIFTMPQLVAVFGIEGIFYSLALVELIAIVLLVRYLPGVAVTALSAGNDMGHDTNVQPKNSRAAWVWSGIVLIAILAFFIAVGCFWTYIGLIGKSTGLTAEAVGKALSIAGVGGILGSMVPIFLEKKIGALVPLLAAFAVLLAAVYLTSNQTSMTSFMIAAMLFMCGWYVFNPYQLGVLASIDRDGRAAMASAALTGFGLGLGPAIISEIGGDGFSAVYSVSTISLSVAIVILACVIAMTRKLSHSE